MPKKGITETEINKLIDDLKYISFNTIIQSINIISKNGIAYLIQRILIKILLKFETKLLYYYVYNNYSNLHLYQNY